MDFSQRFIALRKSHKLTQEKAGELVNMSQRSIANWESGERLPSISTLIALSDIFNVSVDYLLGCTDIPDKQKEPTVSNDELRAGIISRVQSLPDPALLRVGDFLAGLEAGQAIGSAAAAAPDPDAAPSE